MPPPPEEPDPPAIRPACPEEFPLLREIELSGDAQFEAVGIGPFSQDEEEDHLARAVLVLVAGDPAVGFASVDLVDGHPHLWQLSVHPSAARRGLGSALVAAVCDWSRSRGHVELSLTTYRDVAWNGPFYARLGFEVVEHLTPQLQAIRDHERLIGDDDYGIRVAMRKLL